MLDDQRQTLLVAGGGGEADDIEARSMRWKRQFDVLLGRQVDDDDPVDPGAGRVVRKRLRAVAVDRVIVAHQDDRGLLVGTAQLANERESTA